ncbi:MAG: hypothetical protein KIS96_08160 [Bauldia sp.]|nr:hypothetical protein [Bauldia sp.]
MAYAVGVQIPPPAPAKAMMRYRSPFNSIVVPVKQEPEDLAFVQKWIQPFYLNLWRSNPEFIDALRGVWGEIDEALVFRLLSRLNWRSRATGAYFAALKGLGSFDEHIGKLLLRSDGAFAGVEYCLALARFNTPNSVKYLQDYLSYYLTQGDLAYDQPSAMAALGYLDRVNGTASRDRFVVLWSELATSKPTLSLAASDEGFERRMRTLERVSDELGASAAH